MTPPVRIGLAGAGLIGRRHAAALRAAEGIALAALADPDPAAAAIAAAAGVPLHPSLAAMLAAGGIDGVYLATPNRAHAAGALAAIAAGLPVLVEKPLAGDLAEGRRIVAAGRAAGVPVAVGHHRRHNPLIAEARALIDAGALGRIAAVQASVWLMKPDDYFDVDWRRRPGAGPILVNLIHDVDLLQHLCGPVVAVQAMESRAIRGFEVEDSAAILLRFASGALGTVALCDTALAPWSWELTARENPAYPVTGEDCYWIAGTHGSLALPNLTLWQATGDRSWWAPIAAVKPVAPGPARADPLVAQAEQFAAVVRGHASPLVDAGDGLSALAVIDAVRRAAAEGGEVRVDAGAPA